MSGWLDVIGITLLWSGTALVLWLEGRARRRQERS